MNQFKINSKEDLELLVTKEWNKINSYIDSKAKELPIPIYSSVDIRESRDKFAPVDLNIYPAGFNNVCALDLGASSEEFEKAILSKCPNAKNIAIIPESNTKNTFYLDHLIFLGKAIRDAGFSVDYISFDSSLFGENDSLELSSFSKLPITFLKAAVDNGNIKSRDGEYDFVILNNDQSSVIEIDWDQIQTPIHPTPKIGWFQRQKIKHFEYYKNAVNDFASEFSINPDLLQARFRSVDNVDFSSKEGIEEVAKEVDLLKDSCSPDTNIFIKASQGTYGMGISVVKSGEEVLSMNRKTRNKMDIGKNKIKFTKVLIQEGVETVIKYDDMPAEVTIYLVDGKSLGGFMRANKEKDSKSNLNSRGMVFKKYCISEIRENQDHKSKEAVYSIIARLATLAAGYEIKEVHGENK